MKINLPERIYEGTGVQAERAMTIKADAMMFQKFAKDLYKNPLKACFRELLSNAIDACDLDPSKVSITLPSVLDKTLVVEDFGRGMSDEFVLNRYSVVGETTKSDTNGQIGGFGMGKMTSLALTNSFSIVCNDPQETRTYSCFKNQEGKPNVARTFRGKNTSSKISGVTVRVPIDPTHFKELQEYATFLQKTIYLTYGTTFKIVGAPFDTKQFDEKVILHQKGVGAHMLDSSTSVWLCIGGIPYEIDRYKYRNTSNNFSLYNTSVLFFANIGEFNVTLSREEIEESQASKETLNNKATTYRAFCEQEALALYNNTVANLSEKEKLKVISSVKSEFKFKYLSYEYQEKVSKYSDPITYIQTISKKYIEYALKINSGTLFRYKGRYDSIITKLPRESYRLLVNDTKLSYDLISTRILRASKTKTLPTCLKDVSYIIHVGDKKTKQEIESEFPALDTISATEILKEFYPDKKDFDKNCSEVKNYERIRFKKANNGGSVQALTLEEVEEITDKVYYTTLDEKNFIHLFKASHKDSATIKKWINKLHLANVYLVPKHKEKLLDTSIFIKLDDILADENSNSFMAPILQEAADSFYTSNANTIGPLKQDYQTLKVLKDFSIPKDVCDFIRLSGLFENVTNSYNSFYLFSKNVHFKAEIKRLETVLKEADNLQSKLKSRYPLIVGYQGLFQFVASGNVYKQALVSYLNSLPT